MAEGALVNSSQTNAAWMNNKGHNRQKHTLGKLQAMQMKGKGKGWMPARAKAVWDETRQPVETTVSTGKVEVLKCNFGFIKPDAEVDHPMASKRKGLIYFDNKDVKGSEGMKRPDWVTQGVSVSFKLYADGSGLGAHDVTN
eukprot:TRINITY_DN10097_c0_g1_i3.p1 TRINITY_DN10097_c0_g1~~TRINITY_DN10097_c0_g1_i3.p1  ORF type:complete len:141 (+),score=25.29 TRINITY_DN10097_c0_g1_i3:80-502(+)